ncbi:MAG: glutathione peroxidase [Kofleriaceae bacterium]
MNRLAFVLLVMAAACAKKEAAPEATRTEKVKGPSVTANKPVDLPPAGTAPPPVTVTKEIPMWNAPLKTLQGKDVKLADFRGKALMLVNVASKCGNTPQYAALEALQKKYEPQGFTVIGFPCNQFGGQEPGTAKEIEEFCSTTYGVTFPLMEKVDVNGANRHEVYKTLTPLKDASGHDGDIRWNFEKFVVSADGTQITRFDPEITPNDPTVIAAVEQAIAKK